MILMMMCSQLNSLIKRDLDKKGNSIKNIEREVQDIGQVKEMVMKADNRIAYLESLLGTDKETRQEWGRGALSYLGNTPGVDYRTLVGVVKDMEDSKKSSVSESLLDKLKRKIERDLEE